jgi:endonuclease III related protein
MPAGKRLQKLVEALAKRFEVEDRKGELTDLRDPFLLGAWYILGQHAKRNGQVRAFDALRRAKGLTPGKLLDIPPEKMASICQLAGPYEDARARELQAFADDIEDKCGQDFAKVFKKPLPDARNFLERVLRKPRLFADLLLMYSGFPVFALDAPALRAALRLGYGKSRTQKPFDKAYLELQAALRAEAPKNAEWMIRAHGLLHRLGVEICQPVPRCLQCPLVKDCPYPKKHPELLAPPVFERRETTFQPR